MIDVLECLGLQTHLLRHRDVPGLALFGYQLLCQRQSQEYPSGLWPPKKAFNGNDLVIGSGDLLEPGKNWQTGTLAPGSTHQAK